MQLMLWDWLARPIVEGLKKLVGGSRSGRTKPEVTARSKLRGKARPVARPVSRRRPPPQPTPNAAPEITPVSAAPDRSSRASQRARVVESKIESGLARSAVRPKRERAGDRYDRVVAEMVVRYGVKVRRWRTSMSGVAYEIEYRDGTKKRLIESPRPRSPLSMAIFLHEIGHHAIGLGKYKPRCLEEYHAWMFSLHAMEENGLEVTDKVRARVKRSLEYAVSKAARRGIKNLPAELHEYVPERMKR